MNEVFEWIEPPLHALMPVSMLFFEVQSGKHKGKRLKLSNGEFVIGRDEDVSLRITSAEVSRKHCVIRVDGDDATIEDLGSSNGTFLDGFPIKGVTPLHAGSVLTVGPMSLRLVDPNAKATDRKSPKKDPDTSLSDDDIATWLAENDQPVVSSGDTTIIPARIDAPASPVRAPIPPKKKKEFKSVAEEAQDIIRRFHESQGAAQASGGSP